MQGMKCFDDDRNEYVLLVMTPQEAEDLTTCINDRECWYIDQEEKETEKQYQQYWKELRQKYTGYWTTIYRAIHNGECDEPEEI